MSVKIKYVIYMDKDVKSRDSRRTFLEKGNKHRLNSKLSSTSARGIEQIELRNIISVLDESLWWMWTPTDQFIGLTGLTATWEKSCNTVNTSHGIAALWWLLSPITCIYSCGMAVAAPSRMQNRAARRRELQSRSICHHFEGLGGKMQDHLFSIPLSLLFSLLIEADLYQAPVALTPVTITGYTLLHQSGLLTAEWQLDNPLWNDLGLVSAGP